MKRTLILALCLFSSGCYYYQAARGQYDVLSNREPIEEIIAAEATPEELAARLQLVTEARQFAIDELHLPDNDSYRSYSDLERDYVVWNVFAAPEFSLEPKTWCFPIAGCVAYRGYFSAEAAERKADELRDEGLDVVVAGVPAYSTLGKFDDPVLNTMMHWDDTTLIATIFHELAHQVLYIKDDSGFNEAFASAVEEFGIERWLDSRGDEAGFEAFLEQRELSKRLLEIVTAAKTDLDELYSSSMSPHEMRLGKQRRIGELREEFGTELERSGRRVPGWLDGDLNNAQLASMGLYQDRLPEFRALYEECGRDLLCFYERAEELAE